MDIDVHSVKSESVLMDLDVPLLSSSSSGVTAGDQSVNGNACAVHHD